MERDIELRVVDTPDAVIQAGAEEVVRAAGQSFAERGRFVLVLSGGRTPQPLHRLLATTYRDRIDWANTHVWFGDERCVMADDAASNYGMARSALLDHVDIPPEQVHPLAGGMLPGQAALQGEQELRAWAATVGDAPLFDVVMLGAGPDGHTASLFPDGRALLARDRLVVSTEAPERFEVRDRLTMTLPALESTRLVLMLATGGDKRSALKSAYESSELPVGRVRGRERTLWIVDAAAWSDRPMELRSAPRDAAG
jgi:6-phosphogluconolactonase